MTPSIEQALERQTKLSSTDLARAAGRRSEMGGRLETALLELGLVREKDLTPALSSHYGMPAASVEDLEEVPESVQALLSREQAGAYNVVPFAAGPGRIDLAVGAPLNLEKADELAFLLGRRVRFYILNEVRIAQALHRIYRLPQPARLLNLADRLEKGLGPSRDLASDPHTVDGTAASGSDAPVGTFGGFGASPGGSRPKTPGFVRRPTPLKPREELRTISLTEEERRALVGEAAQARPGAEAAPPVPASDLGKLSHHLQGAQSPTAVGEAFLDYLENFCAAVVVLRPEGELFRGWLARGFQGERGDIRQLMTGPGLSTEWREMLADEEALATELTPSAAACGLADLLGLEAGDELLLVPVRVQQRVVALAVGTPKRQLERGERELLGNASLRTGLALQSWILRHKAHSAQPS